jgi:uncharacterized protein
VDIGLKDSGLVHISQMANRYIKSPYDVVAVGDVVTVWVLTVDKERHRVSLTMIKPGTERRPPERKPAQGQQQGSRPPRGGRRPQPQPQPQGAGQGPPPRRGGPGRGPGPRRQGQGQPAQAPPEAGQAVATAEGATTSGKPAAQPPRPAPPPRRPRREPPKPKLSQAALEGKAPLRTFAELSALLAAKQTPPRPQPAPAAPAPAPEATAEPAPVAPAVQGGTAEKTEGAENPPPQ